MRQQTRLPKEPAEKVVQDIRRATRKHYSAEEKIRIVLEGLRGEDSIAELCRREGIAQNLYYRWSKDFLEAGEKRLRAIRPGPPHRVAARGKLRVRGLLQRPQSETRHEPPRVRLGPIAALESCLQQTQFGECLLLPMDCLPQGDLRVCPGTSNGITKFSEHEAD